MTKPTSAPLGTQKHSDSRYIQAPPVQGRTRVPSAPGVRFARDLTCSLAQTKAGGLLQAAVMDDESMAVLADEKASKSPGRWTPDNCAATSQGLGRRTPSRPDSAPRNAWTPGFVGIDYTPKLGALLPRVPILLCTHRADTAGVVSSLMAGAIGYLVEPAPAAEFLSAIRKALRGLTVFAASGCSHEPTEVVPPTTQETTGRKFRVAVVDDDKDIHLLIKDLLQVTRDFICAGCFCNAGEALKRLPFLRPDVVLMDIRMPDITGIECAKRLKGVMAGVKIVMMTGWHDAKSVEDAVQAGADGYLTKPVTPDQFLAALKFAVARGTGRGEHRLEAEGSLSPMPSRKHPKLTLRENELMNCFAQGLLYKEAADKLGVSYGAIHKLQHKIFVKLHVSNRTEAISKWRGENGGNRR